MQLSLPSCRGMMARSSRARPPVVGVRRRTASGRSRRRCRCGGPGGRAGRCPCRRSGSAPGSGRAGPARRGRPRVLQRASSRPKVPSMRPPASGGTVSVGDRSARESPGRGRPPAARPRSSPAATRWSRGWRGCARPRVTPMAGCASVSTFRNTSGSTTHQPDVQVSARRRRGGRPLAASRQKVEVRGRRLPSTARSRPGRLRVGVDTDHDINRRRRQADHQRRAGCLASSAVTAALGEIYADARTEAEPSRSPAGRAYAQLLAGLPRAMPNAPRPRPEPATAGPPTWRPRQLQRAAESSRDCRHRRRFQCDEAALHRDRSGQGRP